MRPLIVAKSALKGELGETSKICLHSEFPHTKTITKNKMMEEGRGKKEEGRGKMEDGRRK